jgi:hypothetical protein
MINQTFCLKQMHIVCVAGVFQFTCSDHSGGEKDMTLHADVKSEAFDQIM